MKVIDIIPFAGIASEELICGITPPTNGASNSIDMSSDESVARLREYLNLQDSWCLAWLHQVHGDSVICIEDQPHTGIMVFEGDALVTGHEQVLLITRHADCPPLLLWDQEGGVIGIVHAGRRSTFSGIAHKAIDAMVDLGAKVEHTVASIGPGIKSCCYEVGEEVYYSLEEDLRPMTFELRHGKIYCDLYRLLSYQLLEAGVRNVFGIRESECTCCGPRNLHSYRRDGTTMRFAAFVGRRA